MDEDELYLPDEEDDDDECGCGEDTCVCPIPGPSWELRQILADAIASQMKSQR
jgi:hypothetical protein